MHRVLRLGAWAVGILAFGYFVIGPYLYELPIGLDWTAHAGGPALQALLRAFGFDPDHAFSGLIGLVGFALLLLVVVAVASRRANTDVDSSRRALITTGAVLGAAAVGGIGATLRALSGAGRADTGWGAVNAGIQADVVRTHPEYPERWKGARVEGYRRLGRTGWRISDIVVGSGHVKGPKGSEVVRDAIDRGVTYVDTSPDYAATGSENAVADAIEGMRDRVFLATKFCTPYGHLPAGTPVADYKRVIEESLTRLRTDYVDLAHVHACDSAERPMDENLHEAFERLREEGKVRFLGFSRRRCASTRASRRTPRCARAAPRRAPALSRRHPHPGADERCPRDAHPLLIRPDERPGGTMTRPTLVLLAASLWLASPASAGPWDLPAADSCQPSDGVAIAPGSAPTEDASAAVPFDTGDVFTQETLEKLTRFLPGFIWTYRERFFFEGMRLEIGPCFHDYGAPAFYQAATEAGRGKATLTADGGLEGYGAGRPFAADELAQDDPRVGDKWLWNVQNRYQAAGFRGDFRMTDLVGRTGRAEPFIGNLFKILLSHRADRPAPEYEAKGAKGKQFVAGGAFLEPFDARSFAWRQFRDVDAAVEEARSDDLHAYLPKFRRVRRLSANQIEGIYMPSFSVGVSSDSSVTIAGGGDVGSVGSISGGGSVGGTIQTKRSGWEGLELRPLLYDTKVLGVHDVLAPINTKKGGYPVEENRDFGPWGLSFADDTWDLRRALVLETKAKGEIGEDMHDRQILYVDLQTLQPLYVATFDKKEEMTNVGMYVSRWSEDRENYPPWPDAPELPVRVLDSVGVSFANLAESGSWRRESWEDVGTPPSDAEVRRLISVSTLTKGR